MKNKTASVDRGYGVFLIPGITAFLIIIIIPFLTNIGISFTKWGGVRTPVWTGLNNYQQLIGDSVFWLSFRNNLILLLAMTIIPVIVGLLMATFLFDYITNAFGQRVSSFFRAGFYLPQILPSAVIGIVWAWILQPDWGVVNYILKGIGLSALTHNWLGDPSTALLAVMVVMVWFQIGYPIVIFMAALQRVDPELLEAASIDGASWLQKFWYITIHQIRPEILVVVLTTTIYTLKIFGQVYVLTGGGPGNATSVPSYYAYKQFFETQQVGYGSTVSLAMAVIIIILTILFINLQSRQENAESA
jgi:raffinose/stachyose/melibiose transport system permease protein